MRISIKISHSIILILTTSLFALHCFAAPKEANSQAEPALTISLRTAVIRKSPQSYAPQVTKVLYGDAVKKLEESDGWLKVSTSNGSIGYIPLSAVTVRQSALKSSFISMLSAPQESEIALAGKGFSEETENQFKKNNQGANFAAVDKFERDRVTEKEIKQFVTEGKLL